MIRVEKVFIEVKKTRTNAIPVKDKFIQGILNRNNPVGPTLDNSGTVKEFGVCITIRKPFFSGFLFPK